MGHGPRGLQRQRRRLVVLQPRPGPLARLPLGRGRAGRAVSDEHQRLCFALALWNEQDPILKERLFGLTNSEGNHGEDVKEYYFYVDNLPTHTLPALAVQVPAGRLPVRRPRRRRTARRSRFEMEYELLDTGVFDDDRYFDVEVTYAKAGPDDLVCRIAVHQPRARRRADPPPADAVVPQHVVVPARTPPGRRCAASTAPRRSCGPSTTSSARGTSTPPTAPTLLFCDNETNAARPVGRRRLAAVPEGRHRRPRRCTARRPSTPPATGTKVAAHVRLVVPAGGSRRDVAAPASQGDAARRRRSPTPPTSSPPGRADADEFYDAITPDRGRRPTPRP